MILKGLMFVFNPRCHTFFGEVFSYFMIHKSLPLFIKLILPWLELGK